MCPYCGQGLLEKWLIKDINAESYVCSECDMIWYEYGGIGAGRAGSASAVLDWLGYRPLDYHLGATLLGVVDWPERE